MNNRRFKKAITLLLAVVLTVGLVAVPSFAVQTETACLDFSQVTVASLSGHTLADAQEETAQLQLYDDDELVTFIVTLEEAGIANAVPAGMRIQDFLGSVAGEKAAKLVEKAQTMVQAYFQRIGSDIVVERSFSILLNGFAVTAPYGSLEELWKIPGVASVAVSQRYAMPQLQDDPYEGGTGIEEGQCVYSGQMMQSQEAANAGYSGEGMVIAVLDSALDITHPDFAVMPDAPALDQQSVADVLAEGNLNVSGADADSLYYSEKIPFVYDYAQKDTDVADSDYHGTHVSGSAVGNSDAHKGVAPDAQLIFMKVFDNGSASDADIMAALEDCAILGVDVINLSLGQGGGFTYVENYEAALDMCRQLGIQVVAACGNDSDARYGLNNTGENLGIPAALVSEPDSGFVTSPSTNPYALSVASAVRSRKEASTYVLCADQKLYYTDPNAGSSVQFNQVLQGEYEYVMVPGAGTEADYEGLDVTGKLAVVQRGQITFVEKEQNAVRAGAVGLIIVNTDEEIPTITLEKYLPAALLRHSDGQILAQQVQRNLTISGSQVDYVDADRGGLMAVTSSLGVAPDMTLKPEITAPGQGEYSAVPGGGYENHNGTSMATPQISGASALLTQYYESQYPELTKVQIAQRVSTVLMNTAKLITDEYGVTYTPRKQGSGLAQIMDAIGTEGYVTVEGNHRPVAQLGSSQDGSFAAKLTVHNITDTDQAYDLGAISLVPKVETVDGYLCMSNASRQLSQEEFTVSFSQDTLLVPAGGSTQIEVVLQLTEAGKAGLTDFVNGIYLDGYFIFDNAEGVDLHVPYIGFYGDWYALDIFDNSVYEEETPSVYGSRITCIDANGAGVNLGVNAFDATLPVSADYIAVGEQYMNQGYLPSFWYGLLRGAKTATLEILDESGQPVELYNTQTGEPMGTSEVFSCLRKSAFLSGAGAVSFNPLPSSIRWLPAMQTEQGLAYLPDGTYTVRLTAMPDGTSDAAYAQSFDMPLNIDNQMPEVVSYEVLALGAQRYLSVSLRDNHVLMGVQLADEAGSSAYTGMLPLCAEQTDYLVDVTALADAGVGTVRVYMCDYARNYVFSDVISLDITRVLPESITLKEDTFQCQGPQTIRLEAYLEPETVTDPVLIWASADECIATVTPISQPYVDAQTGKVSYLADVDVKDVTGQTTVTVTTEGGLSATAYISVKNFDKTALDTRIRQAQELQESDYTVASWESLQMVLKAAQELAAVECPSQKDLDEQEKQLAGAMEGLVKAGDPTALQQCIADAEDQISDYTLASATKISECLAQAKTQLKARADQASLDAAEQALAAALKNGQKKPAPTEPTVPTEPAEPEETKPEETVPATEPVETTQPTEQTESTEPSEPTEETEDTKSAEPDMQPALPEQPEEDESARWGVGVLIGVLCVGAVAGILLYRAEKRRKMRRRRR